MISNEKQIEQLRGAFHGRGIRERVLHRVLLKDAHDFTPSEQRQLTGHPVAQYLSRKYLLLSILKLTTSEILFSFPDQLILLKSSI